MVTVMGFGDSNSIGQRTVMNCIFRISCMIAVANLFCPMPASAQTKADRAVELFTCKDVMREPNVSRETAIAFLHGYLLGKSGSSHFNVEAMETQTNAFIEQCLDSPQNKAAEVMEKLKK